MSKFDLVCEHEFDKLALAGLSLLGIFVGSLGGGILADKFGRKTALIYGVTLTVPQIFLAGFAPNYWIFAGLRYRILLTKYDRSISVLIIEIQVWVLCDFSPNLDLGTLHDIGNVWKEVQTFCFFH